LPCITGLGVTEIVGTVGIGITVTEPVVNGGPLTVMQWVPGSSGRLEVSNVIGPKKPAPFNVTCC